LPILFNYVFDLLLSVRDFSTLNNNNWFKGEHVSYIEYIINN